MHFTRVPVWLRLAAIGVLGGLFLAAWWWQPWTVDVEQFAAWFATQRHDWTALPIVLVAFVVLGLLMVPVMLLIAATGMAFGPFLGPVYAMAGCLASASAGFAVGRWIGLHRVEQLGGERIARVTCALKRNGTLAVFLARKVPAPFTLTNIIIGASTVRYWDFILGTVLGLGVFVVGVAGFGYQLREVWRNPEPRTLGTAALLVAVPLMLALLINHALRKLRGARLEHNQGTA
jgi:uncharacterized membrane protein YdjX (TVP38/TMEM64 family)